MGSLRLLLVVGLLACGACHHEFSGLDRSTDGGAPHSDQAPRGDKASLGLDLSPCLRSNPGDRLQVGTLRLVACESGDPVDQQTASSYCNAAAGWRACTVDQYGSAFKSSPPPPGLQDAWLAGCLDSYDPGRLLGQICTIPPTDAGPPPPCAGATAVVATQCTDPNAIASSQGCSEIGLVSAGACWQGSRWKGPLVPRPAYFGYNRALCCK